VNLDIIPRDEYATYSLKPGDRIEIVQFVGGG
jgi:thiamine biosynthesis protein ThiS